ncbi:MAG: 5-(carboxyamino)imidazole ribonucleotide mutase [Acidobacteria bacterium]|nr:MAG: 5-(carboxyamino)imidazole ribonucleotide mutase [Acidobacteriota bacterium]PYQ64143.1 MAG: 5-(carboxyamino)imidazole ribonucleotide mutase [Acidobacteriota bacterium]
MNARTSSVRRARGNPDVVIFMGSDSDWTVMAKAAAVLEEFGIPHLAIVSSAHRTHDRTVRLVKLFTRRGTRVFIAGAGAAAHLAGAVAAVTPRPVIGVPLASSPLSGLDSLLSTAQMPSGIPVACTAIGEAGARNAGLLAVEILAVADRRLERRLESYRSVLEREVVAKDARLQRERRQIATRGKVKI